MVNRITPLLLFIGFVWAQTDFDKLVLKDGTTYFGEYSKIEGKIVFFKPQDAFGFQPVPVKLIQTLKLKDGHFIIEDGKNSLTLDLAFEAYQKLSTKEKAIYDAKSKNLVKWALYGPTSIIIYFLGIKRPSSIANLPCSSCTPFIGEGDCWGYMAPWCYPG